MAILGVADSSVPKPVTFATADGASISALLYGDGNHAVVLAHGMVFNKESWRELSSSLADSGFTALALDFRGYGESKAGSKHNALEEDVLGAVRYLHRNPATRVSIIGASMGAGAAAKASMTAAPGEIDKLILLSPPKVTHPERVNGKILVIGSKDEPMAATIKAVYEGAPKPKRLVMLDGHAHAQHIFKTDQSAKLRRAIIDFLKE